jgi:hypothetical protein
MRRILPGGLAALAGLMLIFTSSALARRIAPPPIPDRVARADCVVIGKVTAIEDKTVKTAALGELSVAVVKIDNGLLGAKGLTHVKVGFQPGGLMQGQEACFFLTKVPGETFFTAQNFIDIIRKAEGTDFGQETSVVKRCAGLLDEPMKGLQAKDAGERLLTASLLIGRYRTARSAPAKQEPIDAAESKLILETLAEADWNRFDPVLRTQPATLFLRLGLTPAEGWKQPTDFQQIQPAAKEWLKANADRYRIKRFVSEEKR